MKIFLVFFIFISFVAVDNAFASAGAAFVQSFLLMGAIAIVGLIGWGIKELLSRATSSAVKAVKGKTSDIISNSTIDNSYYAEAEQEIDENGVDKGL